MKYARSITRTLACGLLLACGPSSGTTNGDSESSDGCPPGAEGCPCPQSGGCDDDLQCVDEVCAPGPGGTGGSTGGGSDGGSSSTTTTGGPGTITSASTGTSTTEGCEFVCTTTDVTCDGVPGLDGDPRCSWCDLFAQDCPDGEKCAPWDADVDGYWDSVKCVELSGDGQPGEPCAAEPGATGEDDCDVGVMCWNLDENNEGTCVALCTGSPDEPMCPESTICNITGDGVLNLCLPQCDPLQQDCPEGELCINYPSGEAFVCVLDASDGMAPAGSPCEFANVCNPGLMCLSPDFFPGPDCEGALGCCAPFCNTDNGDVECEGLPVDGLVCLPFYEDGQAPPEYESVGVCAVPQP